MKKFFTQILTAIGLVIYLVGAIMGNKSDSAQIMLASATTLYAMLATAFVFSKNATVKNMGYIISAVAGVCGIRAFTSATNLAVLIMSVGLIAMMVPAIIFFIIEFFSWLGFTRKSGKKDSTCDIVSALNQYKELEKEAVLTPEEFESIKSNMLKNSGTKITSVDDLKKWKKLFDQQIITEEEFSQLKAQLFAK